MKMTLYKVYFFFFLAICFNNNDLYCVEKIFSEYYQIQEGDNVEKIIRKKIWFKSLKKEEKNQVISNIKKWYALYISILDDLYLSIDFF